MGEKDFVPSTTLQTDFGSNPLSNSMGTVDLFLGVKRPERETGHSPCLKQRLRMSKTKPLPLSVYLITCYRATFTFFVTFYIKNQRDIILGQSPCYVTCNKRRRIGLQQNHAHLSVRTPKCWTCSQTCLNNMSCDAASI